MTEFSGRFAGRITGFLDERASRGFKRETYIRHFTDFDAWCIRNHPGETALTRELVHDWIADKKASAYEISHRCVAMRQFGKYLCAIGEDAYVLPTKYAPYKSRAAAYIFTDAELAALFASIDRLPPTKNEPFMDRIAPVMFRLIYTCGLRPK